MLQVPPSDPWYAGPAFSGIWVYMGDSLLDPVPAPTRGDRVRISGRINDFFGQRQIFEVAALDVLGDGRIAPADVNPDDVATDGLLAESYEGVLVRIDDVEVTGIDPPLGPGDRAPIREFVVDDRLRVDDYLHLVQPRPAVGSRYTSITGVLRLGNGDWKLEPRDEADVRQGVARVVDFGPAGAIARVGIRAVPELDGAPLLISLDFPAPAAGLPVSLRSDAPGIATVPAEVIVPAGATEQAVAVTGVGVGEATLRAIDPAGSRVTTVRVVDADTPPETLILTVFPSVLRPGEVREAAIEFDTPAPLGGLVAQLDAMPGGIIAYPRNVVVPGGQRRAAFEVTGLAVGATELTVRVAGLVAAVQVQVQDQAPLVVNEVDYDQPGADTADFVELRARARAPLAEYRLQLVNGNGNAPYVTLELSDAGIELQAGELLVVGSADVIASLPAGTPSIQIDSIQNGPDGVRIVRAVDDLLIDGMSYEGVLEGTTEGNPAPEEFGEDGLSRCPDGADTDDNSADFSLRPPTPGLPNACP